MNKLRFQSRNCSLKPLRWISCIFLFTIAASPTFADRDRKKFFTEMPSNGRPIIFAESPDQVCEGQEFVHPVTGLIDIGKQTALASCIGTRAVLPTCTGAGQTGCYIANDTPGPLIAVEQGEVETHVRFGVAIGDKTGKVLPMITPEWQFDNSDPQKPIFSEGKSKTDWMKMTGSEICPTTDGWMPATRSDFNLAATIGGFTNDANTPLLAADPSNPVVYSDGAAAAYQITDGSDITPTSADDAKKVCVTETSDSSILNSWSPINNADNDYLIFKRGRPAPSTTTLYLAVEKSSLQNEAVACSSLNALAYKWRPATIADLQFAIDTDGVGGGTTLPLAYDTPYLTADSKRYTFTAANEQVTEVTDERTAGATICVKHRDAAGSDAGSGFN